MNTTVAEGVELAKAVVAAAAEVPADVKLVIAPPFTRGCLVRLVRRVRPEVREWMSCCTKQALLSALQYKSALQ